MCLIKMVIGTKDDSEGGKIGLGAMDMYIAEEIRNQSEK